MTIKTQQGAPHPVAEDNYDSFETLHYLKTFYSDPKAPSLLYPPATQHFILTCIHRFYNQTLPARTAEHGTLLEFGGGPVVSHLISAAPHVSKIVFSDYCPPARVAVQQWVGGAPEAHDWMPFFRYVVGDLEGDNRIEAANERSAMLRQKIVQILHCDAKQDSPIGTGFQGTFDIVSVSFCLESACDSHKDVVRMLKNIAHTMKSGAWIRVNGVLGGSYYHVKKERFFNLTQTESNLRASFEAAGFHNLTIDTYALSYTPPQGDYKGMYHLSAQRNSA